MNIKKISSFVIFCGCLFGACNLMAVDVIKPEDAPILDGIGIYEPVVVEPKSRNKKVEVAPTDKNYNSYITEEELNRDNVLILDKKKLNYQENLAQIEEKSERNRYLDMVNDCKKEYQPEIDVVTELMYTDDVNKNVGYVQQAFNGLGACYDVVGVLIVKNLYKNDALIQNQLAEHKEEFVIDPYGVEFNPKFCGESCGVRNIIIAQVSKFNEYYNYMIELVQKAKGIK